MYGLAVLLWSVEPSLPLASLSSNVTTGQEQGLLRKCTPQLKLHARGPIAHHLSQCAQCLGYPDWKAISLSAHFPLTRIGLIKMRIYEIASDLSNEMYRLR